MAKKKKKRSLHKPPSKSPKRFVLPEFISKHPSIWSAALILILLFILYHQTMFQDKEFLGHDTLNATLCYRPFIDDALERGIYPLWNPYIFSGMPSFASLSSVPWINFIDAIINHTLKFLTQNDFTRILFNYLLFGWLMFFLIRKKKLAVEAALFAGVTIIFMPQFVAFGVHGHHSKLLTLALIPLIIYLVDGLLTRRNLLFLSLTALVLGFQLLRAHVQVVYYTYMLIGFYFLFIVIDDYIQNKKIDTVLKITGLLAAAIVLAIALSSVVYISVYEYSHYSIRGGGPGGGLDYEYATNWSFSPLEMMTFIVPGFAGFGGKTYWGPMSYTDYPLYMGILPLFFVGIAFILRRDKTTWFFTGIALFSLLVSFGRSFPLLYWPMYKFLPFFNKFRVPSMIHILLDISVIIVAVIGLNALLTLRERSHQKGYAQKVKAVTTYFYIFGAVGLVIFMYLLLGESAYGNLAAKYDTVKRYLAQGYTMKILQDQLIRPAFELARWDGFKMVILLALGGTAIIAFLKNKLSRIAFIAILLVLTIIDLWWADFRIISDKYDKNRENRIQGVENYFAETPAVKFLKNQKEHTYRIFDADQGNENWYMYHLIEHVDGYNAAKLRIYQEARESLRFHPIMLAMLNTRYTVKKVSFKITEQTLSYLKLDGVPDDIIEQLKYIENQEFGIERFLDILERMIGKEQTYKSLIMKHSRIDELPFRLRMYRLLPDFKDQLIRVFESPYALPRAFFVQKDTVFLAAKGMAQGEERYKKHRDDIFNFMISGKFIPHHTAIIEEEPPFAIEPCENNQLEIVSYDIHEIELKAEVEKPAHLVLSEIYYPAGWKAYVDGKETRIYKTNYLLRSVFLAPGKHSIKFIFDPASFTIGFWLSLLTFIVLIAVIILTLLKEKRQRKSF